MIHAHHLSLRGMVHLRHCRSVLAAVADPAACQWPAPGQWPDARAVAPPPEAAGSRRRHASPSGPQLASGPHQEGGGGEQGIQGAGLLPEQAGEGTAIAVAG